MAGRNLEAPSGELARLAVLFRSYFDPPPGSRILDSINATAVAVAVADTVIHTLSIEDRSPFFFWGWSGSPTAFDVRYIVTLNGTEVQQVDNQPTPDLWTPFPIRLFSAEGPHRIQIRGQSTTGAAVAGVRARIVGWPVHSDVFHPHRFNW